jgi:hypothetical protein
MAGTRRSTRSSSRSAAAASAAAASAESSAASSGRVRGANNDAAPEAQAPTASSRVAARASTMRAVADREASRLARPERRSNVGPLAHASKLTSAVSSTPSGVNHLGRLLGGRSSGAAVGQTANASGESEAWCGPFSVARQMIAAREEAKMKREAELAQKEQEENGGGDGSEHPLDSMVQQVELQLKRKLNPSMRWKASIVTDTEVSPSKKGGGRDNLYVKRQKRLQRQQSPGAFSLGVDDNLPHSHGRGVRRVKSLFQTCVDFLVENFENVESLGSAVDCSIRTKICRELVSSHKFTSEAFEALAEPGIEALELVDCASVSQDQLADTLRRCLPLGLTGLILDHSGRCFGPKTVQAIVESIPSQEEDRKLSFASSHTFSTSALLSSSSFAFRNSLMALSIGGAYLLTDIDAARLIRHTCTTLHSIEFKACPLLKNEFVKAIGECYGDQDIKVAEAVKQEAKGGRKGKAKAKTTQPSAETLVVQDVKKAETPLLELSLQDIMLTKDIYKALAASGALRRIRNLKLHHMNQLDDEGVECLMDSISSGYYADQTCAIEGINLAHNLELTDDILAPIRKCNRNGTLQSLVLTGVKNLTAVGLEALFTRDLAGLPNPPTLRRLDVGECGEETVNDAVVELAVSLASRKVDATESGEAKGNEDIMAGSMAADSDGEDEGDGGEIKDVLSSSITAPGGGGGMVYLNLNGAIHLTDKSLENIATHCATSLHELDLSFCPHVSDQGLGYLVSQVHDQMQKLCIWGCAQLSDTFHDGHRRVMDSSFEVEGAWMKRASQHKT